VDDRDAAHLWDMVEACREVQRFLAGKGYQDLLTDRMMRLSVERDLEIIGEAANRVSSELQAQHPEIPWARIVAQRNVISHEYGDIKLEWIWGVATERVPELIALLEPLIPPAPEGDKGA
jgi:uncharacterized protein with HEPN domain